MKNCIKCNHKFTFNDRLKSILNLKGYLKCSEWNSVYKSKVKVYRAIYTFLVIVICSMVYDNTILKPNISNFIFIVVPILLLFDDLPHR